MDIELEYLPGVGFRINQHSFVWGMSRETARQHLGLPPEVGDHVVDLKKYFPNEDKPPIEIWRDIYMNWQGGDNYFFLCYDREQRLTQLELHWGIPVRIGPVVLSFGQPLASALQQLAQIGFVHRAIDEGMLFDREKFTLSDSETMGGDGDGLAYFYAADDISHLFEDL